jgi:hypothetical protein
VPVRDVRGIWRVLSGGKSDGACAASDEGWYYPRAWLAPDAGTFMVGHGGRTFRVSAEGSGGIEQLPATALLFVFDAKGVPSTARVIRRL